MEISEIKVPTHDRERNEYATELKSGVNNMKQMWIREHINEMSDTGQPVVLSQLDNLFRENREHLADELVEGRNSSTSNTTRPDMKKKKEEAAEERGYY